MKRTAAPLIDAAALAACATSLTVTTSQHNATTADLASSVTKAVTDQGGYRFTIATPAAGGGCCTRFRRGAADR